MKALILLPLFALLPFLAFSNGVPEITQDEKEITIEMIENGEPEIDAKNCYVTAYGSVSTPIGSVDVECTRKAVECIDALILAIDCVQTAIDEILEELL